MKAVFDLLCKDKDDRQFIIEMQKAPQPDYAERSIFYLSRAISASLARGQLDYEILPSYSVNILDFDLQEYRKKDQFFHAVFLKDQNNEVLTQKVEIFFIKLCNFAARRWAHPHWRYPCQQSYGVPPGKSSTQIIASSEHPVRGAGTGRTGMPAMSSSHAVGVRASGDNLGYRVQ